MWGPHDRQIDLGSIDRFDKFQLVLARFYAADVQQAMAGVEAAFTGCEKSGGDTVRYDEVRGC